MLVDGLYHNKIGRELYLISCLCCDRSSKFIANERQIHRNPFQIMYLIIACEYKSGLQMGDSESDVINTCMNSLLAHTTNHWSFVLFLFSIHIYSRIRVIFINSYKHFKNSKMTTVARILYREWSFRSKS